MYCKLNQYAVIMAYILCASHEGTTDITLKRDFGHRSENTDFLTTSEYFGQNLDAICTRPCTLNIAILIEIGKFRVIYLGFLFLGGGGTI